MCFLDALDSSYLICNGRRKQPSVPRITQNNPAATLAKKRKPKPKHTSNPVAAAEPKTKPTQIQTEAQSKA